jgi:hypothetical protein
MTDGAGRQEGMMGAGLRCALLAVCLSGCIASPGGKTPPTKNPPTGVGGNGGVATWPPPAPPGAKPPTTPPPTLGPPISAPAGQWTWVDIPGSACADGSQTGFAVNMATNSKDVLIFLEGGGACWDGSSCWGTVPTSFYMTGYGPSQLSSDPQLTVLYVLNRSDAANPFKDMNLVFLPYCTGDAFAGASVTQLDVNGTPKPTHFVGAANMRLFLERLVPTFSEAGQVWLGGDSAGGFGAGFNYGRVRDAFPNAKVGVLDDSGPPIEPDPARWALWLNAWDIELPPDCPQCVDGPAALVDYYSRRSPDGRFGLISYEYDSVIAPFMNLSSTQFQSELYSQLDHMGATWPNGRYFVIAGSSHVGMLTPSQQLKDWVSAMVAGGQGWSNTRP